MNLIDIISFYKYKINERNVVIILLDNADKGIFAISSFPFLKENFKQSISRV